MNNAIVLLSLVISTTISAQQANVKEAFLEKWENSKNYLIEMAESMPEEYYDYKPTERQRSFKEQLIHIKENMDWLSTSYFSASEIDKVEKELTGNKEETIELVRKAFDTSSEIIAASSEESLKENVDFFAGKKSKIQILNLMQDHVTHHRGQLIVYLNLKQIEPPRYVGW